MLKINECLCIMTFLNILCNYSEFVHIYIYHIFNLFKDQIKKVFKIIMVT